MRWQSASVKALCKKRHGNFHAAFTIEPGLPPCAAQLLPLFAEIRKAERRGGLILALVAHARRNEDDDGHDVGQHLIQLLDGKVAAGGNKDVENVESAEEDGREHADARSPHSEDDERYRKPAAVSERIV